MPDPTELRRLADEDREQAAELADDMPGYSEYLERRADWRERLARDEEEYARCEK